MTAIEPSTIGALASAFGGGVRGDGVAARAIVRVESARVASASGAPGDLTVLSRARYEAEARAARERGVVVLVDSVLAARFDGPAWVHPRAAFAIARVLERAVPPGPAIVGEGCVLGRHVVLEPGVVLGARVIVGHGAVLGARGFGFVTGERGEVVPVPHAAGVVVEDDVAIGNLSTVDAGSLSPTRVGHGTKIDAHVPIGHNADVGPGCFIAAQTGLAGSVVLGRGVVVGGQAGFADHVRVGDGAKIAGKSGVIGDVPAGAVVAGYPAVPRVRWLRSVARSIEKPRR